MTLAFLPRRLLSKDGEVRIAQQPIQVFRDRAQAEAHELSHGRSADIVMGELVWQPRIEVVP